MKLILILMLALFSMTTFAKKNIWTQCGIGAMVFSKTGWAAATSNITWDLGTTATSSQVSSDDQCAGKSASVAKFIFRNYAKVEEDTAMGGGKYTTAMLDILKCDHLVREKIIKNSKSYLRTDLNGTNKKAENYFNSLIQNIESNFKHKCQTV
ncbi:MAG: DUF3015 domain-containing protein [Bacteriovoracaceae bacterium]|jgi:hypothetical protein|nr:DUF3015 domain-containing protein [Bacteriovoracaceae bacterium]